MNGITRRSFLKRGAMAAAGTAFGARLWSQVAGANGDVRIAIVGLNSRGRNLLRDASQVPGVRIAAFCDVDTAVLDSLAGSNPGVARFVDFREMLEAPGIDAVAIASPNHQHALQAIWAMQAGKDVYLEKPVTHNLWEGSQIVAAESRYGRIVQSGTQGRSSQAIAEAIEWTRAGNLGRITAARGLCYKRRTSIGRTTGPQPVPATVDYNLWLGPAPMEPLRRTRLHYDWHWQWPTGNGDIANQGNHQMDIALRFLGEEALAPRVFAAAGRFGYEDDGDTPNTMVAVFDYGSAPLIFEVRGLPAQPDASSSVAIGGAGSAAASAAAASMDSYLGTSVGNIIHFEGGHLMMDANNYGLVRAFDRDGRQIREFRGITSHMANFIDAVRSRRSSDLNGPIRGACVSAGLCHAANISYCVGREMPVGEIRERVGGSPVLAETFGRMIEHLGVNGVDLAGASQARGMPLTLDPATERFTGESAAAANALHSREYRAPFVVPQIA
jgi:predicted dehydrogenase